MLAFTDPITHVRMQLARAAPSSSLDLINHALDELEADIQALETNGPFDDVVAEAARVFDAVAVPRRVCRPLDRALGPPAARIERLIADVEDRIGIELARLT